MSHPEIAIHKKYPLMENPKESRYLKCTQKDYRMSLKLEIVQEIERGQLTLVRQQISTAFNVERQRCNGYLNMVTLIGRIKSLQRSKNDPNKRLWSLKSRSSF